MEREHSWMTEPAVLTTWWCMWCGVEQRLATDPIRCPETEGRDE